MLFLYLIVNNSRVIILGTHRLNAFPIIKCFFREPKEDIAEEGSDKLHFIPRAMIESFLVWWGDFRSLFGLVVDKTKVKF